MVVQNGSKDGMVRSHVVVGGGGDGRKGLILYRKRRKLERNFTYSINAIYLSLYSPRIRVLSQLNEENPTEKPVGFSVISS
jgi:hypothetical protein